MTVTTLERQSLNGGSRSRHVQDYSPWQRPSDWLPLPTVGVAEQKVVGLYAVFDHDGNFCAFQMAGAYTVDWGDGSAPENFAANVIAGHTYDYNDPDLGPLTSEGFKTVVVTATPQAGQNFTLMDLGRVASGGNPSYATQWLDIRVAGPQLTTAVFGSSTLSVHRMVRRFEWVSGPHPSAGSSAFFQSCTSLEEVVGSTWTNTFTVFLNFFNGCVSLKRAPFLDTRNATNFTGMFASCTALEEVPLYDTSKGVNFTSMFSGCTVLRTIPLLNTSLVTNFSTTFQNCVLLETIPLIDTSKCAIFSSIFQGCTNLRSIPLLDTHLGSNLSSMFNGCAMLKTIPLLNTSAALSVGSMFNACANLQTVPALDMSAVTSSTASMFAGCTSLSKCDIRGMKLSVSFLNCRLSGPELDRIYTNLASGVSAQTVTVTGNWGIATDTPSIATAKGWTVTGS